MKLEVYDEMHYMLTYSKETMQPLYLSAITYTHPSTLKRICKLPLLFLGLLKLPKYFPPYIVPLEIGLIQQEMS